jgi:hypothetical protein
VFLHTLKELCQREARNDFYANSTDLFVYFLFLCKKKYSNAGLTLKALGAGRAAPASTTSPAEIIIFMENIIYIEITYAAYRRQRASQYKIETLYNLMTL